VARRGEEEARRGEEEARRTAEVATLRATAEREAKDAALAETERLRSLLLAAGILLPDVS
jgi:hypothetical protein